MPAGGVQISDNDRRRSMRLALAIALICAAVAALPAPAAADTVVRSDERIGSFLVKADGTLGGAWRAFGVPSRSVRTSSTTCSVTWARLGLRIGFYNLGGLPPCGRATGHFSNAVMTGCHWRTGKGLRIGDRVMRLRSLYPGARYRADGNGGEGWWLVTRRNPTGPGTYPGLLARTRAGFVTALVVRYPAGGD
jgi:hypothetical protein